MSGTVRARTAFLKFDKFLSSSQGFCVHDSHTINIADQTSAFVVNTLHIPEGWS